MRRALALIALGALCGCYSIRYHTRAEPQADPSYSAWHHDVILGMVEASPAVNVSTICPGGVARVDSEVSVGNRLANLVTLWGFWYPSTVKVTCARAGAGDGKAAAPAGRESAKKALKIAVLKLQAKTGVEPSTVDIFTDALVGELRKHPGVTVLSPSEVSTLLGFERQKQLLGCSDTGCLSEIAGAMGADRLVSGTLGRVGKSLVVYLSSVDSKKAMAVATVSERLKTDSDEAFLDELPGFVGRLLAEQPAGP